MTQYTLLFDLDGTLADTNLDLHTAMNHVLALYGYAPISDDRCRNMIGGGARTILTRGFAEHNHELSNTELDTATALFVDWYEQNIDAHTRLYPHVENLLKRAHHADIALAVITNKRESLAAKLLFRLGVHRYFATLIGGDTLATCKPAPEPIIEALHRLKTSPANAIMLGDSENDTQSARASGVQSCCVSFGYRRVPIEELGADAIIDDFAAFDEALKQLHPEMAQRLATKEKKEII